MPNDAVSASTDRPADAEAAADLARQLDGADASAVLLFFGHERDGGMLVQAMRDRFPSAEVIGCTSAGEFTERSYGVGGAVAVAISRRTAPRAVAALARFDGNVYDGIRSAGNSIAERL